MKKGLNNLLHHVKNSPKGILFLILLITGIVARSPVAAYSPLEQQIESVYHISPALFGVVNGLPVFCFAGFVFLGSFLVKKFGLEVSFLSGILLSIISIFLRMYGGFVVLLLATVLLGASIAIFNICIPLIIARDFKKDFSFMNGLVSASMNVGSFVLVAVMVPIVNIMGFRLGFSSIGLVSILLLILFAIYLIRKHQGGSNYYLKINGLTHKKEKQFYKRIKKGLLMDFRFMKNHLPNDDKKVDFNIYKHKFTYIITILFAIQSLSFYVFQTWLPTIFVSHNYSAENAGFNASIFQIIGIFGSIFSVNLIKKLNFKKSFTIYAICWLSLPLGLWLCFPLWPVWVVAAGFAQGANYILILTVIAYWSKSPQINRKIFAFSQFIAYICAGTMPIVMGILWTNSHSWTPALIILSLLITIMIVLGIPTYNKLEKQSKV